MVTLSGEMKEQRPSLAQALFVWFLRAMAVAAMVTGLSYWAQLVGLSNEQLPRFDLLPVHWQVPCVILAVLLPVASMGLWSLSSWGIVLWAIACVIQISIYGIWSDRYASRPEIVVMLAASLAVLLGFLVVIGIQRFRERSNDY